MDTITTKDSFGAETTYKVVEKIPAGFQVWNIGQHNMGNDECPGLISFRVDWLDILAVQGLSRVFSNTTVQKHLFFGAQLSL